VLINSGPGEIARLDFCCGNQIQNKSGSNQKSAVVESGTSESLTPFQVLISLNSVGRGFIFTRLTPSEVSKNSSTSQQKKTIKPKKSDNEESVMGIHIGSEREAMRPGA